jgi:hypothetical protein
MPGLQHGERLGKSLLTKEFFISLHLLYRGWVHWYKSNAGSVPGVTTSLADNPLHSVRLEHSNVIMHTALLHCTTARAVFTHGSQGPGPRAANFQGRHIKKSRLKYGMLIKKAVHERES